MFIHQDIIDKKVCKNLINVFENSKQKIKINNPYSKMTKIILNFKDLELHEYLRELNEILKKYIQKYKYVDEGQEPWTISSDIQIQKYEHDIRKHIGIEHQLQLYADDLKANLKTVENE